MTLDCNPWKIRWISKGRAHAISDEPEALLVQGLDNNLDRLARVQPFARRRP
jgi:hypothetical protein